MQAHTQSLVVLSIGVRTCGVGNDVNVYDHGTCFSERRYGLLGSEVMTQGIKKPETLRLGLDLQTGIKPLP